MHLPRLDDTIVAVSTAWTPSPAAIVRLSGPAAVALVESVSEPCAALQARYPQCKTATIRVDDSLRVPARVYAFRGPQSYTGQDLSEIHTVGCLPVVRALATRLIELGARPALPGEFTSRAFLLGKLDAGEVDRVLGLIHAADAAAARQATRAAAGSLRGRIEALGAEIADTLAAIEAGIDFVDEEDVRFITDEQVVERLSHLMARLDGMTRASLSSRDGRVPHVALAGLPNAGKSTLFNTLIGRDRAIVSPVLGTTRDVLCAETNAGRVRIVLQDCAGLGASVDELERAAHVAAEQAAEQADLVLWVHDGSQPWQARESAACERFPVQRRILVVSQSDRAGFQSGLDPPIPFAGRVEVSSASGSGIDELRGIIERHLDQGLGEAGVTLLEEDFHAVRARLEQALTVARTAGTSAAPELVSLELRSAWDRLSQAGQGPVVEEVLGRIFTRFCIGK